MKRLQNLFANDRIKRDFMLDIENSTKNDMDDRPAFIAGGRGVHLFGKYSYFDGTVIEVPSEKFPYIRRSTHQELPKIYDNGTNPWPKDKFPYIRQPGERRLRKTPMTTSLDQKLFRKQVRRSEEPFKRFLKTLFNREKPDPLTRTMKSSKSKKGVKKKRKKGGKGKRNRRVINVPEGEIDSGPITSIENGLGNKSFFGYPVKNAAAVKRERGAVSLSPKPKKGKFPKGTKPKFFKSMLETEPGICKRTRPSETTNRSFSKDPRRSDSNTRYRGDRRSSKKKVFDKIKLDNDENQLKMVVEFTSFKRGHRRGSSQTPPSTRQKRKNKRGHMKSTKKTGTKKNGKRNMRKSHKNKTPTMKKYKSEIMVNTRLKNKNSNMMNNLNPKFLTTQNSKRPSRKISWSKKKKNKKKRNKSKSAKRKKTKGKFEEQKKFISEQVKTKKRSKVKKILSGSGVRLYKPKNRGQNKRMSEQVLMKVQKKNKSRRKRIRSKSGAHSRIKNILGADDIEMGEGYELRVNGYRPKSKNKKGSPKLKKRSGTKKNRPKSKRKMGSSGKQANLNDLKDNLNLKMAVLNGDIENEMNFTNISLDNRLSNENNLDLKNNDEEEIRELENQLVSLIQSDNLEESTIRNINQYLNHRLANLRDLKPGKKAEVMTLLKIINRKITGGYLNGDVGGYGPKDISTFTMKNSDADSRVFSEESLSLKSRTFKIDIMKSGFINREDMDRREFGIDKRTLTPSHSASENLKYGKQIGIRYYIIQVLLL